MSSAASSGLAPDIYPDWSAKRVTPSGLVIQDQRGQRSIPIGGQLPNGETLMSVEPQKGIFITDRVVGAVKSTATGAPK